MRGNTRKQYTLFLFLLLSILALFYAVRAGAAEQPAAADETFCSVEVTIEGEGEVAQEVTDSSDPELKAWVADDLSYVLLENSQLVVRYEPFNGGAEFAIRSFRIKEFSNQDQIVGAFSYMDADLDRGALASAYIAYDGSDRKTVHLEWFPTTGTQKIVHEVSIYPNSSFIKIDYIDVRKGVAFVDLANPGGTVSGAHVAYGGDEWIRGYVTIADSPDTVGSYYNRYPADGVNDPADGGSLNYNSHFILGNYNPQNGVGYARVLPVQDISIIKLLLNNNNRRGFELYPYPFNIAHQPFTGYIYAVTGGADEVIAQGKRLADSDGTTLPPQCGDTVELTAEAAENYEFDGWTGDLETTDNPATLVLTGVHQVTANFSPSQSTLEVNLVPEDGSGGTVEVSPDKPFYETDEEVTVTAVPEPGWSFVGWSGDLSGANLSETLVMDSDKSVTATFEPVAYSVVVTTVGNGTVTVEPDKDSYTYGDNVTITATPNDDQTFFNGWGGDLAVFGQQNPINLSIDDDILGVALFGDQETGLLSYVPLVVAP